MEVPCPAQVRAGEVRPEQFRTVARAASVIVIDFSSQLQNQPQPVVDSIHDFLGQPACVLDKQELVYSQDLRDVHDGVVGKRRDAPFDRDIAGSSCQPQI